MEAGALTQLIADIGAAAAFGTASFMLLRAVLKDSAEERAEWLKTMREVSDNNVQAVSQLERALVELRAALRDRRD